MKKDCGGEISFVSHERYLLMVHASVEEIGGGRIDCLSLLGSCYPARMKQRVIPLVLALIFPLSACKSGPKSSSAPIPDEPSSTALRDIPKLTSSGFDFYLLNLSWSPEYCHSHPNAVECSSHAGFVLHGLWPQKNDGSYPENCSAALGPSDPTAYKDIYPDPGLLEHEWQTHGTCSGLSADDYLTAARNAFNSVTIPPTLLGLTSQSSMPPEEILGLFTTSNPAIPRSSLALSCGNNYLTAVEVCLDKSLRPIACPGIRTCRARAVRIPPP
jgi:ribonuclease T2